MRCKELRKQMAAAFIIDNGLSRDILRDKEATMDDLQEVARTLSDGAFPQYQRDPHGIIWRKGSRSEPWEKIEEETTK